MEKSAIGLSWGVQALALYSLRLLNLLILEMVGPEAACLFILPSTNTLKWYVYD